MNAIVYADVCTRLVSKGVWSAPKRMLSRNSDLGETLMTVAVIAFAGLLIPVVPFAAAVVGFFQDPDSKEYNTFAFISSASIVLLARLIPSAS